jgi:hypothetical protein
MKTPERLDAAVERLLARHKPYTGIDRDNDGGTVFFEACEEDDDQDWPCDERIVLDALAALRERERVLVEALTTAVGVIEEEFGRGETIATEALNLADAALGSSAGAGEA